MMIVDIGEKEVGVVSRWGGEEIEISEEPDQNNRVDGKDRTLLVKINT